MKALTTKSDDAALIESVIIQGDLSRLTPAQKVSYYNNLCESLGLNTLTKPFDYMKFQGREVLYANKGCAEQLRMIHDIGLKVVSTAKIDDVFVVTAEAVTPSGRTDSSTGAVSIAGLNGVELANAMMKAETKAKRRVTLSICGLNMLDELEVETLPREIKAKEIAANLETEDFEHAKPEPKAPELVSHEIAADYVIKVGKNKGKQIKDLTSRDITNFTKFFDEKVALAERMHPDVEEYYSKIHEFLAEREISEEDV